MVRNALNGKTLDTSCLLRQNYLEILPESQIDNQISFPETKSKSGSLKEKQLDGLMGLNLSSGCD